MLYKNTDSEYSRNLPKEFVSPILKNKDDINSLVDVATLIDKNCVASKTKEDCKQKSGLHVHIGIFPERILGKDGLKNDLPQLDRIKQIVLVYSALEEKVYSALEEKGLKFAKRNYDMKRLHEVEAQTKIGHGKKLPDDVIIDAELTDSLNDKILTAGCVRKLQDYSMDKMETTPFGSTKVVYEPEDSKSSVNIEALYKHGTIEFRGHGGTVNPKEIAAWVSTINSVVGIADDILEKNNGTARLLNDKEKQQVSEVLKDLHENNNQLIKPEILSPAKVESSSWEQLVASTRKHNSTSPRSI